jgi:hypothetical protein
MKWVWLLLLCCAIQAQEKQPLRAVLRDLETQFDVRYSYADSIVDGKQVAISKISLLPQIHREIEIQCQVSISAIDSRYFTITPSLEPTLISEIEVMGFLSKGVKHHGDRIVISPHKIEELPGVTDADLLLALQHLPGVKSPNETASGLHVRGGTPDQNLILVDGIRVYHPGQLFGMISAINPQLAKNVTFYSKATPSRFGDRVSGIIDIKSDGTIADSISGSAGVNLLYADASMRLPIIPKKADLQLTARRSLSPWWESPALRPLSEKVFQQTDFDDHDGNDFGFHDISARLGFKSESTTLAATGILIDNSLDYGGITETALNNQQMRIKNMGASVSWSERFSPTLTQTVSAHYSDYEFRHRDLDRFDSDFSAYLKQNRAVHSGASIVYDYKYGDWNLEGGYQLSGQDVSHRFDQEHPGFSIELGHREQFAISHASFVESAWTRRGWELKGGFRYTYYHHLKVSRLEPRFSGRYNLTDAISVIATFETRSQIESQVQESATNDLSLENYVWTLSDGAVYPLMRGKQFSVGSAFMRNGWLVNAEGYYKTLDGVTSMTFGFFNPDGSGVLRGDGFVRGAEILVQRGAPGWRIWTSYNWQQAENRYDRINGRQYFPTSADIMHDFSIAAFKKWNGFSFAAGWNLRSGRPYSTLENDGIAYNQGRLASYHRLNMSAAYEMDTKHCKVRFGVSLLNVYNRRPVINTEYRRRSFDLEDFFAGTYQRFDYEALGFTPNAFVRIYF